MLRNKIKTRKGLFIFIFAMLFFFSAFHDNALAKLTDIDIGSKLATDRAQEATNEILKEVFHIDLESAQEMGEGANNADKKSINVPDVNVYFNPTDPKEGQQVTAKAYPMYFKSKKEKIYFTWYIKHKGCDLYPALDDIRKGMSKPTLTEEQKKCDVDGDGFITVNDWKVEAMRPLVQGGWEPEGLNVVNDDLDGALKAWYAKPPYGSKDDDGYRAWQGGDDQERKPVHCYVHNSDTGEFFELLKNTAKEEKGPVCLVKEGNKTIEVDPVCVKEDSYSTDLASYDWCTCWDDDNNPATAPVDMGTGVACGTESSFKGCKVTEEDSYCKKGVAQCEGGGTPVCPTVSQENHIHAVGSDLYTNQTATVDTESEYFYENTENYSYGTTGQSLPFCSCDWVRSFSASTPICSKSADFVDEDILCNADINCADYSLSSSAQGDESICANAKDQFHLFPQIIDTTSSTGENYYTLTRDDWSNKDDWNWARGNRTGNKTDSTVGEKFAGFEVDEERFWRTDPNDPDTANNGNVDEATVAGKGMDQFTWSYKNGDKIGVIVEGTSMNATKYDDASYMVMWAFLEGKQRCQPNPYRGDYEPPRSETGSNDFDDAVTVKVGTIDFDRCTEQSLVAPGQGGQATKLEISVSASSENPMNDPSPAGANGDTLSLTASVDNSSTDEAKIEYAWEIKAAQSDVVPTAEDWLKAAVICGQANPTGCAIFGDKIKPMGNGLSALDLKLAITGADYDDIFTDKGNSYFRVKVTAKEYFDSGEDKEKLGSQNYRKGSADMMVKVGSIGSGETIKVFQATVGGDGKLSKGEQFCIDSSKICTLTPNEILALEAPKEAQGAALTSFAWKSGGKDVVCDQAMSTLCEGSAQGSTTFVAVTESAGKDLEINVTGSNIETGSSLDLSRTLRVTKPYIKIVSEDSSILPKILGTYTDLDGKTTEDLSQSVLTAAAESTIKLKAEYYPPYMANAEGESWTIDGASGGPEFEAGAAGSVHNVSISGFYQQPVETRKALKKFWGVAESASDGSKISSSVQIEVIDNAVSQGQANKFLANLFSNTPGQIMFLLRLMLTGMIILVTTGIIFSLFPESQEISRR